MITTFASVPASDVLGTQPAQSRVRVASGPAALLGAHVLSAHVREGVNSLTRIDLIIRFNGPGPAWGDLKHAAVKIEIDCGGAKRPFWGIVVGLRSTGGAGAAAVTLSSALWRLSQRSTWRVFLGRTSVEILEALVVGPACRVVDLLRQPPRRRDRSTQTGETHLAFVTRLLADDGINFFLRHGVWGEEMVLVDHNDSFDATADLNLDDVPIGRLGGKGLAVPRAWQVEHRCVPDRATVADIDPCRPHMEIFGAAAADGAAASSADDRDEVHFGSAGVSDPADADAAARLRLEQLRGAGTVLSGNGDDPRVGAGHRVAFQEDNGGPAGGDLAGEWVCVAVEHHVVEQGYGTGTAPYRSHLDCVPAAAPVRPPQRPIPRLAGDHLAFVVDASGGITPNRDRPVVANDRGHVRIRFAAEQRPPGGEGEGGEPIPDDFGWVPVGSAWGGAGGTLRCPRVAELVIVRCLEGNPDFPVVWGSLASAADALPHDVASGPLRTTWESRPTATDVKGYHMIGFDDDPKRPLVVLHSNGELHESATTDQRVSVGRDQHVDVGGSRAVRIAGAAHRHVKGSEVARVDGDAAAHVAGDRRDTVDKDYDVNAGGVVTIKGKTVIIDADAIYLRGGGSLGVFSSKFAAVEGPPDVKLNCGVATAPTLREPTPPQSPTDPLPALDGRHG